ncbi:MAG: lamin tail domain-containing protein, partial [Verrucomicrobiales bacterium]
MLARACLLFLWLGIHFASAQDEPVIRIVGLVRDAGLLTVTVENTSGGQLDYTLQHSPDLSANSWTDRGDATLSTLDPARISLTIALEEAAAGFVRVRAEPATLVSLVINEVMSNNEGTIADGAGDFPDWIEFYNTGDTIADLSGHHLSDNDGNLEKWAFPDGTLLAPGGYLLLFASGKSGDEIPAGELHASFKLSNGNEPVILSSPDSIVIDRLDPGPLQADSAVGRSRDASDTYYLFGLRQPTPGEANHQFGADTPEPFIQAPIFSIRGGLFAEPVIVDLISPTGDGVV